eukprot:jgi/Bigna1/147370/aug1.144_g22078
MVKAAEFEAIKEESQARVVRRAEDNKRELAFSDSNVIKNVTKMRKMGNPENNKSEDNKKVWVVGLSQDSRSGQRMVSRTGRVENHGQVMFQLPSPPRYQEQNVELLHVNGVPSSQAQDGVLVDDKSHKKLQKGEDSTLPSAAEGGKAGAQSSLSIRALGVELEKISLATAKELGVLGVANDLWLKSVAFPPTR